MAILSVPCTSQHHSLVLVDIRCSHVAPIQSDRKKGEYIHQNDVRSSKFYIRQCLSTCEVLHKHVATKVNMKY